MMNKDFISTKIYDVIIIGGLIVNPPQLFKLSAIFKTTKFVDINQLTVSETEDYVIRLIKDFNSFMPIILVGYSTGGLIALNIHYRFPIITKVILINSTPYFIEDKGWQGISHNNYKRMLEKLDNLSLVRFKDHFCCLALFPKVVTPYSKRLKLQTSFCNKNTLRHWMKVLFITDLRERLNLIATPILLFVSAKDSIVPSTNKYSNKLIIKHILPKSTHAMLSTSLLRNQINDFLK